MSSQETVVLCYNRGCQQKYHPQVNTEASCQFHPGRPIFHEGYKSWSCCNKKTTDFTTFLNTPGCKRGYHSNEKPKDVEEIPTPVITQEVVTRAPVYVPKERPPLDTPMVSLKVNVDQQLVDMLNKMQQLDMDSQREVDSSEIKIGSACKNAGCKVSYENAESLESICSYHPGSPVFHEGMKYWSCCQRKTSDFTLFLSQAGCETGTHNFKQVIKSEASGDKSKTCRLDWHQTADEVVISLFAKSSSPDECTILANPVKLNVSLVFASDRKQYVNEFTLFGQINLGQSHVFFSPNKVEITLKKAEPVRWTNLQID